MHAMDNRTAYFARAVNYAQKIFIKSITGGDDIKLFSSMLTLYQIS